MNQETKDAGLLAVVVERLETERLPRALALKEKLDDGAVLDDIDTDFLERVFSDANQIWPLIERHPEYHSLVSRVIHLYHEITGKALENAQKAD